MSLYAIGDFHLSLTVHKPMDVFGVEWTNHTQRIRENWLRTVRPEDTAVITGDHSWGRNLEECREDLDYIAALPGRKILLRGNHDMFWNAKKTERLNHEFSGRLEFLQNNFYVYEDYALVGTKGYCDEGRDTTPEQLENILSREEARLRRSFRLAEAAGLRKYIVFLHFPPTSIYERESRFTRMAEEYGAEKVIYSHCHGKKRYGDSIRGYQNGIEYKLVSSDYLQFVPEKIL
ncbi:MAG: metallophosphoesterase [Clostridiales bacterium]|nr:metallophosphoesterase [Clostridiales bacterium]